jgi:hypothetical protein
MKFPLKDQGEPIKDAWVEFSNDADRIKVHIQTPGLTLRKTAVNLNFDPYVVTQRDGQKLGFTGESCGPNVRSMGVSPGQSLSETHLSDGEGISQFIYAVPFEVLQQREGCAPYVMVYVEAVDKNGNTRILWASKRELTEYQEGDMCLSSGYYGYGQYSICGVKWCNKN